MNDNKFIPITYAPYRHYIWILLFCVPFVLLLVALEFKNMLVLSWRGLKIHSAIIIVPMVMILARVFVDSCTEIVFYEDKINIKHLFNKKCLEKEYIDFTHAYLCQSYRNVTYLVLSAHFFTKDELRKIANKNDSIWDRMFIKDAVFIRINHWSKEKDRIEELMRNTYANMVKYA